MKDEPNIPPRPVPNFVVKSYYGVDLKKLKPGDIVHDASSSKIYICGKKPEDFQVYGNHNELDFIKSNPDLISHIFEDKLKALEYTGKDTNEYIEKLIKLKTQLDQLIVKWI